MFCSKCGNQINQGEKFCSSCGNPIAIIETEQPKVEFPKSSVTKKSINKKVLIPIVVIVSILVVGLIALVAYLGATAPEREMKKALETNDYYTVITAYENLRADGEFGLADDMIVDYINDATNYLNNNFKMSVEGISDDDEIYEEIMWFLYENYDNMFVIVDEYGTFFESGLMDNDDFWNDEQHSDIAEALNGLESMMASKYQYFEGLYELDPSFKEDDEEFYYMNALDSFAGVIEEDINYESAQEKAKEICEDYVNSLIAKADEYIAMGDYSAAVELLNNTILDEEELGVDTNLKAKFDEVLSTYAAQYAAKAEEEFKNGDINAAIGNIEAAILIYPNGEYEAKLKEYELYKPFALYKEFNVLKEDGDGSVEFDIEHRIYANDGTEMSNCMSICADYESVGSVTYYLNGKYDVVTGKYFISQADKSDANTSYFEAYGDGKLLYTSPKIKAGVLPQDISFSVKGIQTLEIRWYGNSYYSWYSTGYLSNFVAKKNIPTDTTE